MADDWQCNICNAVFYSAWTVWNHYNVEHVQNKYICAECSEEFRSKQSCEFHLVHAHKDARVNSNYRYFERRIELVRYETTSYVSTDFEVIEICDFPNSRVTQITEVWTNCSVAEVKRTKMNV